MSAADERAGLPGFLYGTAWKEETTQRCVELALEAGFRGIDTANQRVHYYEEGVGEALKTAYDQGWVSRDALFLQSKFTPRAGQDHRLPYDENAPIEEQVRQSFESSLAHLGTDRLDAYVLHGPSGPAGLGEADWAVWRAMEALQEAGRVSQLGVSNVSPDQLAEFVDGARIAPALVQNRCFAKNRWDKAVREFCAERGLRYQGFSLLTANAWITRDERFQAIVRRTGMTPAQLVFTFARQVGMLPLTGTTDPEHMREDLRVVDFELANADIARMEDIAVA